MKIIDATLYLETADLLQSGVSVNTIKKASYRKSNSLPFIKDPEDQRKLLCDFKKISARYQKIITDTFGDPFQYITKQPIKDLVAMDMEAHKFFTDYRYGDNNENALSNNQVHEFTKAASYMNMIVKCTDDNRFVKKELGLSVGEFYKKISEIIEEENIRLPKCYRRLVTEKIKEYREAGYACLLDKRVEQTNAAKITDELAESVLFKLISSPYKDDMIIARAYNKWAKTNNRKTITAATVGNKRRQNAHLLTNEKEGSKVWFDRFGKVIKGRRTSCPMGLWEHDDNDLDLYYIKDKKNKAGKLNTFYYGRFVVAVVIDTYNDYIVGWAMAEVYTKDLIRLAYLDAMYHIRELTGGWYLPHQIRSDRFGLDFNTSNDLAQFYQKIATYTPAKAKSARGKYIEQSFGKKWHQVLSHYKNYAGHNVQSKAGINRELIETNKRAFPHEKEAFFEIAEFINKVRNLQSVEDGPSRQEAWIEGFNASEIAQQKQINDEQLLMLFGTTHTFHNQIGDNKVQITSRGIEVNINKHYHEYDIPDELYMQVVGKRVNIIYDPLNPDHILVTDHKNIRFIASKLTNEMKMPRALIDYQPGDRARLNSRLRAMEDHVKTFTDAKDKRDSLLELNRIDTDGVLQSGLLIKGQKQYAELAYQNNLLNPGDVIEDALDRM